MPSLLPHVDPNGLLEYSVVYTDRALNHMSNRFQDAMKDISSNLKSVYGAKACCLVPGGGTFGMEAVARQFATDKKCLIIRNGYFSFRWTQIFETGDIPSQTITLKARPVEEGPTPSFGPPPLEEILRSIESEKPDVVFAAHVETSAGMILPDEYICKIAAATHEVGGLFVLDCIASGTLWVDMGQTGVDILITAPQKGWSGSPCAAAILFGSNARAHLENTQSTSFAADLKRWMTIMESYENGGHAYHATMPTDGLLTFRDVILEAKSIGFQKLKSKQIELGGKIRSMLEENGFKSVAAKEFSASSVIVSYTDIPTIKNGAAFKNLGVQIAAGVPLKCDEPNTFHTFRIGLFGLEKLLNIDGTVSRLRATVEKLPAS